MKKTKLIGTLSLVMVSGGLMTTIPFISTSCGGADNTGGIIDVSHLEFSGDNTTVLGFLNSNYDTKWGSILQIPEKHEGVNVVAIQSFAFFGREITSIEMPNSITTIGEGAFSECEDVITANIPSALTSIGKSAFGNCKSWNTDLILPSGITIVPENAFIDCRSLTRVEFNGVLTNSSGNAIATKAFQNCDSITSYIFATNQTTSNFGIGDNAFANSAANGSIYGADNDSSGALGDILQDMIDSGLNSNWSAY